RKASRRTNMAAPLGYNTSARPSDRILGRPRFLHHAKPRKFMSFPSALMISCAGILGLVVKIRDVIAPAFVRRERPRIISSVQVGVILASGLTNARSCSVLNFAPALQAAGKPVLRSIFTSCTLG